MMDNTLDIQAKDSQSSYIKVIGVGGAGTNAVNHMYNEKITGVDFLICNTDEQSLSASPIQNKIKIGEGGLGAGNNPAIAKQAAIDAQEQIKAALSDNTHMLFITAGMGGGTGTGASPEIAKIAKTIEVDGGKDEMLVVGIVTTPFSFEGRKRREQAKEGIKELKEIVDAIIVVNIDKLKDRGKMNMKRAFAMADDVLLTAAKGISEIMTANAYIHVDFKDVQSVMRNSGVALMGSGVGEGEDRAYKAIEAATTCDLLNDNDLSKTKNVLLYITCSEQDELEINNEEIETITDYIQSRTNEDVNLIWGYGYDNSLEDKVAITLVATGFESKEIYSPIERDNNTISIQHPSTENKSPEPKIVVLENEPSASQVKKDTTTDKEDALTSFTIKKPADSTLETEPRTVQNNPPQTKKRIVGILRDDSVEDVPQNENDSLGTDSEPSQIRIIKRPMESSSSFEQDEDKNNPVSVVDPRPIEQVPSYTAPKQNTETKEGPVSLISIVQGIDPDHSGSIGARTAQQSQKDRMDRLRKIRELLSSKDGLATVEGYRPTESSLDEILSAEDVKTTKCSFNSEGNITVSENKVIHSKVD